VDLLTNKAGTFLVSRLPLRDDAGQVIGAIGLVLADQDHPETTMQPLMAKFAGCSASWTTRAASWPSSATAAQVHDRQLHRQQPGGAGGQAPGAPRGQHRQPPCCCWARPAPARSCWRTAIHAASPARRAAVRGRQHRRRARDPAGGRVLRRGPGAYTGADRKGRDGKFKLADGGTLFLDEIGDMPLALQSKLLRVLQEQEVEPLGSNRVEPVDVRVIAATSRDLAAMVADGSFRADLYYRLNVLPIRLPPLRERRDDIEALAEALLDDIARRSGLPHKQPGARCAGALAPGWPGNIRELRNVLEQAVLMTDELLLARPARSRPTASRPRPA
jgi:hypothetical protein